MTSPSPKDSTRKGVRKAIRYGYDRFKNALSPSSRLSSRGSESTAALPGGSRSPSPAPSTVTSRLAVTQPALPQELGTAGPSKLGTSGVPAINVVSASPGPATVDKIGEARGLVWSGLETALRVLEKSADAFPPLKLAVGGLVDCLDIVQTAATNSEEYEELTLELTTILGTLNQYLSELGSEDPSGSTTRIALSIQSEVAHIDKRQARSKARRVLESAQDEEDVIKRYRRIEGLFRQLQSDVGLRTWKHASKQHATALLRGMSPVDDARYNSSYSTTVKRRGCTAETREKVQADLQGWVKDPNAAKVYWMNGMAGTGKTTIAYSLCKWLEENQRLGASFFCSRVSSSCRNVNLIIPTIVYQLARYSPAFRSALCKVLENDPDAGKLNVVQQFEKLLREPISADKDGMPEGVVVVIDALDECEDNYGVRLVLGTLLKLGTNLPIKFFVTSRPEPAIRDNMLSAGRYSPAVLHLHDIEQSIVEEDIKKYLKEALDDMPSPPSNEQLEQLAKRAGKLFIYAATVVRYILPGEGPANPTLRLNAMLATVSQPSTKEKSSNKYRELDGLYANILGAAFKGEEEEIEVMRLVLWTVVCAKEPMTISSLASLLDVTEEQASFALQPLRSVLHVSETSGLVSTLHASFPDYMLDRLRSGYFYCDQTKHNEFLAHRCFDVMKEQLRFNICGLESSFAFDKDVPGLEQRIKTYISPTLFYACRYWGEHLQLAGASDALRDKLVDFLTHRLLFWMEVLNINLCVVRGISILVHAESWLLSSKNPIDTQKQAADARDFVTRFAGGACCRSTPHIYLSALPFCARSSSVYAHYWERMQGLMDVRGTAISRRDKAAQATWLTSSRVLSVAFSPDGTRIVSGSVDRTVHVRDAYTGNVVAGPFRGHTRAVNSVAFSPSGNCIASGSDDRTIRVWDPHTGDVVAGLFEGHTDPVKSVAFSPDGARIVSGSTDGTVRVWDSRTGNTVAGPFKGHAGSALSVAFSPDGARIVSGFVDQTIIVWDARTGDIVAGPFEGHTNWVRSVAFSSDGARIASGSDDLTVRVWDACTGNIVSGPFSGHTDWVNSVAFSPDGTCIVSCSNDQTIRVWDAQAGHAVAKSFQGHTHFVNSVTFSPDGTRIASASNDQTIQVWDARTGDAAADHESFEGHTNRVLSVAFSPDGRRIVSGSADKTVRVWNACTGDVVAGPFKGHTVPVNSVVFSLDGNRIVSGSDDCTIQVWDAYSGNRAAGPFTGHTGSIMSVAFSPDSSYIVSGSVDQTLRVWDVQTGNAVAEPFQGHTGQVNSVAFSPDGTRIISGSGDSTIHVWNPHTGGVVAGPFRRHTGSISSVAFSPDGNRIVSGSYDHTICVWDAHTGDVVAGPFEGHTGSVMSVAFSPDAAWIVSSSSDGAAQVWDARSGNVVAGPFRGHSNLINSVAFSPSGAYIASGSNDETIRMWNVRTGSFAAGVLDGHPISPKTEPSLDSTRIGSSTYHDQNISPPDVSIGSAPNRVQIDHIRRALMDNGDFVVNDDGWVTIDNLLLFWVSPDLRAQVPRPHNTLVIGSLGSLCINYQGLTLNESWPVCYTPH